MARYCANEGYSRQLLKFVKANNAAAVDISAVASLPCLRSDVGVLRWLKSRVMAHFVIAAFFIAPLFIVPETEQLLSKHDLSSPFLDWIKGKFESMEFTTVDYRISFGRKAPVSPEIVFLAMDAASTSLTALDDQTISSSRPLSLMRSSFPYPREVYALVCDRLFAAGAKVVAFDILFPAPKPEDPVWKSALERYRDKVVIVMNFSDDQLQRDSQIDSHILSIPSPSLLPDQDPFDERLGYDNYWPDSDDKVRDAEYRNNIEHVNGQPGAEKLPKVYSLPARMLLKAGYGGLIPDDLISRPMRFAGPPLKSFPINSLYEIFDSDSWEHNFQKGEFFRNKIVLIGPQGDIAKDKSDTPYGLMDGAEIHLNAMNALLQKEFLYPASPYTIFFLTLAAGLIAFLLALGIASIALRFLAALLVLGAYLWVLIWAYNGPGWLLPAVGPIGVFVGTAGVGFVYDFVLTQIEKLQLRATFERYTSPNEARYLLEHKDSYKKMLTGTRQPVTILFSDIRGFTTMTESADSQELVTKLNEYLTAMVDCVFRHDGSLDKFIGDAVVAAWGKTPYNFGPKGDAVRAVRSALAMMSELRTLNARWLAEGRGEWHIGIGLNHGEVIVGDIGSQKRKEFAVIGDAVNLASRLESLTKEYKVDILIGESVAELVRDQFHLQTVDRVQVVGKTQPVETFTVRGEKSEALPPSQQEFLHFYEEGVRQFRDRKFVQAKECFSRALEFLPGDNLAEQYLISCEAFILNPPDASWTGVRVMTKK